jgi:PPOX class probable F420-dependent enzyme
MAQPLAGQEEALVSNRMPESYRDLLRDDVKAFAFLATTMPDRSPQVTPLWFDVEGETLCVNTARGRTKDRNIAARPKVALAIIDPSNPYRYVQIRGTVLETREQGAADHIRRLSHKYRGTPDFAIPTGQVRVTLRIRPDRVSAQG